MKMTGLFNLVLLLPKDHLKVSALWADPVFRDGSPEGTKAPTYSISLKMFCPETPYRV